MGPKYSGSNRSLHSSQAWKCQWLLLMFLTAQACMMGCTWFACMHDSPYAIAIQSSPLLGSMRELVCTQSSINKTTTIQTQRLPLHQMQPTSTCKAVWSCSLQQLSLYVWLNSINIHHGYLHAHSMVMRMLRRVCNVGLSTRMLHGERVW